MGRQDVSSRSALVRCYYRRRLFMCFCCVCCEVLYLALYLLHWPAFRAWRPLPVHVPAAAVAWLQGVHGNCLVASGLVCQLGVGVRALRFWAAPIQPLQSSVVCVVWRAWTCLYSWLLFATESSARPPLHASWDTCMSNSYICAMCDP